MNTITQSTPEFRPNIAVIDGKIKTTPLAIAGHFNKHHERGAGLWRHEDLSLQQEVR